jgi:hypothetical protein
MSVSLPTIKRLYAKSNNRCAMPKCQDPIILNEVPVGEICHIKARNKKGPRYDAILTAIEKDDYPNLLLLCRTCHKVIDSDQHTFTPELLAEIKSIHEEKGGLEITPEVARHAALLLTAAKPSSRTTASSRGHGISVAIGGANHAPITIRQANPKPPIKSKYPPNSIGADANLGGYVDYLFGLGIDYWKGVEAMTPGRLGRKIKTKFHLKTRTRHYIGVQRFQDVVNFIIMEILWPSPVGKAHRRNGTKICRSFDEWCHGKM